MVQPQLEETATRLHAAAIKLLRMVRREDDATGMTAPRLSALSVLVFGRPMSLAELAGAEQVRPPTMSRIVDFLVGQGLVTRETVPGDRRSVRLEATDKGRALMAAGRDRRVRAVVERLRALSASERRALERGVEVMEQALR